MKQFRPYTDTDTGVRRMEDSRAEQGRDTEDREDTEDTEDTEDIEDIIDQLATGQELESTDEGTSGNTNHNDIIVIVLLHHPHHFPVPFYLVIQALESFCTRY